MSLKQAIVIKNEFTVKTADGGTRGATPGSYLERYMARDDATEALLPPFGTSLDRYVNTYMMREDAILSADSPGEAFRRANRVKDGVAFDGESTSLSGSEVKSLAKRIQELFDAGKTVFKTVLSFDDDYLREQGVLDKDYVARKRGDHAGHVDQMKLRCAISDGMSKLARGFDRLRWIGVIQFDTMHVHCHIVAADEGKGRLRPDGQQAGKLTERDRGILRRGIDTFLDKTKSLVHYAKNVTAERTFVRATVESYMRRRESEERLPQLIRAALPENKNWWRAGSRRSEMRRANELARRYVNEILESENSGFEDALKSIDEYAEWRRDREDLSDAEYDRLVRVGRRRLEEDCVNGVYRVLRENESTKQVSSPVISAMTLDLDLLADAEEYDDTAGFGYRLRSYSTRLNHHRQQKSVYHDARVEYERQAEEGRVSAASQAAYDFYVAEEQYQSMCLSKYQHLLPLDLGYGEWLDELETLKSRRDMLERFDMMLSDPVLLRLGHDDAETYGRVTYGIAGASQVRENPQLAIARRQEAQVDYDSYVQSLNYRLSDQGLSVMWSGEGLDAVPKLSVRPEYDFDDVKAVDLHHMTLDFPRNRTVSKRNVDAFVSATRERTERLREAMSYLGATGQRHVIATLPVADCRDMLQMADTVSATSVLASRRGEPKVPLPSVVTRPVDTEFESMLRDEVFDIVHSSNVERGFGRGEI